jgi:hypothetical protein
MDGGRRSRRVATDDTTINHQQERWRGNDVGKGCSDGDGRGKGKEVVAAASAEAATEAAATGGWPPSRHRR